MNFITLYKKAVRGCRVAVTALSNVEITIARGFPGSWQGGKVLCSQPSMEQRLLLYDIVLALEESFERVHIQLNEVHLKAIN